MSYQVLARKWRPATFKDLVGQETVTRILTNSLKEDRIHPALIFSGPRGTGKTSTARILAKTLCCPSVKNTTSCQKCKVCEDIDHSRSLDVMEIDGASNNGVEAVRQLTDTIHHLPTGPYKIYIIDEVHMLSISAFNALLKTLEEPPPHVVFIMATTEMRKIPPTVLSRCQILQFQRVKDHLIYQQLVKICQKEQVKTEEQALWLLVRQAQGSLRDAQGLLDQMITFCQKEFNTSDVSGILGLTDTSLQVECLKGLFERDSSQMLKVLNQLHSKGAEPSLFLKNLTEGLRNLLLLKLFGPRDSKQCEEMVPVSGPEKDWLVKQGKKVGAEEIHLLFDMALKGSWEILRVQDTKVFLEMLLLRMSQAPYVESFFTSRALTPETSPPPAAKKGGDRGVPVPAQAALPSKPQKTSPNLVSQAPATAPPRPSSKQSVQAGDLVHEVQTTLQADVLRSTAWPSEKK